MIRFAKDADLAGLKALWQEAFGDPPQVVDHYFAHRHQNEHMLVDETGGVIGGMMALLPVTLQTPGESFKGRYIYAVATRIDFRGQGISTRLLEYAHTFMREQGESAAVLLPASPGLYNFYGKRGYENIFYMDSATLLANEILTCPQDAAWADCDAADFERLRRLGFSKSSLFVDWDQKALSYVISSLQNAGGVTRLVLGSAEACAVWERDGRHVMVKELALNQMDAREALSILHSYLQADAYQLRLPAGSFRGAITQPFGMIRWLRDIPPLSGEPPYLSLALD